MDDIKKIDGLTGIVLCGGMSSRMGREKGTCKLHNKFLVQYSCDIMVEFCEHIMLGTDKADYVFMGYPMVKDEIKGIGPISGIYSCLKASTTVDNFIISCDMPLISADLIRFIVDNRENYDVVIPVFNNFPEPLCAYYNKNIVPEIETFIKNGVYKIQEVVRKLKTNFVVINSTLDFFNNHLFYNVNTPEQLKYIESLFQLNDKDNETDLVF